MLVDSNGSDRSLEPHGDEPLLIGIDPFDTYVIEGVILRLAEPDADRVRVTGNLDATDRHRSGTGRRVLGCVALPFHEERKLRVSHDVDDSELLPIEVVSVRPDPMAGPSLPAQAGFHRADVVNGDDPGEPAATIRRTPRYCLAERGLLGGRVIKCCDHLDVAAAGKGQDEVSGPELRMPSSILVRSLLFLRPQATRTTSLRWLSSLGNRCLLAAAAASESRASMERVLE